MPIDTAEALVNALRGRPLLTREQFDALTSRYAPAHPNPADLARTLIKLRWLTIYQAKKLLSGKGHELVIGQYVILDKLGEGGMGKVYKAVQTSLARVVALKVVRSALVKSQTALKRFRREVKAAAALSHPNIVRVFDAEQTGERHYLAMEYIAGSDLTKLVRKVGALPIPVACSYIRQAALGLQHAHDRGMVHRDIKPSNLLVAVADGGQYTDRGPVKLLDMGLARMQDAPAGDRSSTELTQTGTVIGTPDFMSPEQAKNSSQVDHRSDLYSLGCTFYFLLTGDVPFPTGSPLEKLLQHQMDPPRPIQLLRMDVPPEVAAIAQTLLDKKPERRFQSAAALAHALEPWCGTSVSGLAPTGVLAAEAVDPSSATLETPPEDPFDFNNEDPDPITPLHIRKGKTDQVSGWWASLPPTPWIVGLVALFLVFLVGGALAAGLWFKRPKSTTSSGTTDPPPPARVEAPARKPDPPPAAELEALEKFLPTTAVVVATADLKVWQSTPSAKQYLFEPLAKKLADLSKLTGTDLPTAIERLGLAVAGPDNPGEMFIAQGRSLVTPRLIDGLKAMPGTSVEPAWDGGPDLVVLPGKDGRQYVGFGETTALMSDNRGLVVEGMKKRDVKGKTELADFTLARGMQFASEKPFAVFVALGCRSDLARHIPSLNGLNAAAAGIYFEDRGMVFGVMAVESEFGKATEVRKAMSDILANKAEKGDPIQERLAKLLADADPLPFPKARRGLHAITVVPSRQLGEWFAPIAGRE